MRLAPTFLLSLAVAAPAATITPEHTDFFESKIRPVLASACYECHGAEKQKAGLRLDWREGILKGGESGPALVPGEPEKSLLLQSISGVHAELKMPKNADPLSPATVAAIREWIQMGAPDPRDKPAASGDGDWPAAFSLRKQAWFWQPLKDAAPPEIDGVSHPVDRFLRAAQQKAGLTPAPRADDATIARRLAFVLTGLPPENRPHESYAAYSDTLLASPAFGERWARHWMDWLRYADSHGSEGDPAIPHAWQYRDYLIRALNADVPYPQLVREHIAGDLIAPRLSKDGTLNESAIGPAHLRMVFHGFTPTDALDEFVTFTDNQVDVVSKAFLGLTVSCARCHNHKFDAISQEDYTAMFGIFANARPAIKDVSVAPVPPQDAASLSDSFQPVQWKAFAAWDEKSFMARLRTWKPANEAIRKEADGDGIGPLAAWLRLKDLPKDQMAVEWDKLQEKWDAVQQQRDSFLIAPAHLQWLAGESSYVVERPRYWLEGRWYEDHKPTLNWFSDGVGLKRPDGTGSLSLSHDTGRIIESVRPAGWHSDSISKRHRGVLMSSRFKCEGGRLWVRAAGENATLRYVVDNYPRSGLIYPKTELNSTVPHWISWNLDYWKGEMISLEAVTNPDHPVESRDASRAWFSLCDVVYPKDAALTPPAEGVPLHAMRLFTEHYTTEDLAKCYAGALTRIMLGWGHHGITDDEAAFLDFMVRAGLLPNTPAEMPEAAKVRDDYLKLETQIAEPVRVPGVMEADAEDHPLYIRGDHKKPGAPVPRRFLSALDPAPYQTKESGRRELAASLTGPGYDLASRVIVNRLWHHVFGRGIVATTDNFGKLGDLPTHPELLDFLAREFQKSGGSIKAMLKLLVTSDAFMAQAAPPADTTVKDPENKLLTHWTLRRLEAEAIRDSMLTLTGKLEPNSTGPGVDGSAPRRSVYVKVIRNALDPLLTVFDAPVPSSTRGRRDATNIPAQALTMMNSPLVQTWARDWAARIAAAAPNPPEQVTQLYREAFQREPSADESAQAIAFMENAARSQQSAADQRERAKSRLADLHTALEALTSPVIASLKSERPDPRSVPAALAEWDFESSAASPIPLTLHGGAKFEGGALQLNGKDAWASTGPLTATLKSRTLEAWVSLANLDQAGGGVFTIQDLSGDTFDAIVFAENGPRQWLAGSNVFARTQNAAGPQESDAIHRPVHVAITWADDGTIRLYRDGAPYGQPYKSNGPVTFAAGKSMLQFGCRHAQPSGNRLLAGAIHRARLYDRALTPEEVARTATLEGRPVTREALLAALTAPDRKRYDKLSAQIAEVEKALETLAPEQPAPLPSLALALFNAKEFLYLR